MTADDCTHSNIMDSQLLKIKSTTKAKFHVGDKSAEESVI